MPDKTITLTGEKELRIFMHPLRQKILREMTLQGQPMTAKQLADRLNITPSSAKHHMTRLESIGIVGVHHQEQIHGITATFYEHLPVTVSIGLNQNDLSEERRAVLDHLLSQVYSGFRERLERRETTDGTGSFEGDLLTGIVHLTQPDADALYRMIREFIGAHETAREGTVPFEYALILYNASGMTK
jgi:DNA-binding CsgD family transcriptional regulator